MNMEPDNAEHGLVLDAQRRAAEVSKAEGRLLYLEVWERFDGDTPPWPKCLLAHLTADVQEDPELERMWDLLSLRLAAIATGDAYASQHPRGARRCREAYASIFLSLAQTARRVGEMGTARRYLEQSRLALADVPPGRYKSKLVRAIVANERLVSDATHESAAAAR